MTVSKFNESPGQQFEKNSVIKIPRAGEEMDDLGKAIFYSVPDAFDHFEPII